MAVPVQPSPPIIATGVGFDCRVERPIARRGSRRAGQVITLSETPAGPALLITNSHPDGDTLTAFITAKEFPGWLELVTRQSERMRNALMPPADGKPS